MTPKIGTWPTTALVCAVLVVGLTSPAQAQATAQNSRPGTPEFAKQIDGKHVTVTLADGRDYDGLFAIEGQTLISRGQHATVTLPVDQIVRVEKNPRRIRLHALIGLAVGGGLGAVALAACEEDCVAVGFVAVGFYGGVGAAIGTGVGAILNSVNHERDVIYDSHRRTVAWSIAPIMSPTRRGAAFTVRWR
jgi:hypothetical protein